MATMSATATMESSQSLIQSESVVQSSYQMSSERQHKKKKSTRRHKDEGSISVSKSSEKLHKKMKAEAEGNPACASCARPVYAMERVKAEKRVWHRECFRCCTCNKQLTMETYCSEHTSLYCRPHFKQLFEPKPVDNGDETDAAPKRHQLIICENNPVELPPDVVKASDKPDLGLEQLAALDVRARFQVFENIAKEPDTPPTPEPRAPREKSSAIISKLAKFKARGMDVGVPDDALNGVPLENSDSDAADDDEVLRRSYLASAAREQPPPFCNMSEVVNKFESGQHAATDRHRERKQELQNIRSRLFMGKQAKIKEQYEQSVLQSEQGVTSADKISRDLELDAEKARAIKERFESGQIYQDENQPPRNREIDDETLFNEGISKKSRSIFMELDANAKNQIPTSPPPHYDPPKRKEIPFVPKDVVRAADKVEDVKIETADITDRFKFFETYRPETTKKEFRMTPPRQTQREQSPSPEPYHEPSVVRSEAPPVDTNLAASRHTASRMISVFKQMEDSLHQNEPQGPKPLKRFTPPPPGESNHHGNTSSEESEEEDSEEERRRAYIEARQRDEALKQAQQLARTRSFRGRFENWSESEPPRAAPHPVTIERQPTENEDDGESQLETARSLREKFENMTVRSTVTRSAAPAVHRFV